MLPSGGHEETFSDILSIGHLSDMECNDIYISVYKASKQSKYQKHIIFVSLSCLSLKRYGSFHIESIKNLHDRLRF